MNEPQDNPPSSTIDKNEQVESLRYQMNLVFGAVLVLSFTLTAYLGLQARRASLDLIAIQGPAIESMKLAEQDDLAVSTAFGKLEEFARTHPDFQKVVLSKYHLNTNSAPAAPVKK
jgi:hypothetical protein